MTFNTGISLEDSKNPKLLTLKHSKTGNVRINVTLRRVRVTIVATESNKFYTF